MTRNKLSGRIAALEEWQENQGLGAGGTIIIWGKNDPDREIKEAKAERLRGKVMAILLDEEDAGVL